MVTENLSLSSTQTERGACLDDVIIFTCTVTEAYVLQWAIDSVFDFGITKFSNMDEPGSEVQTSSPDVFNVTLLAVERNESLLSANLTSELAVTVTHSTLGKHVYCGNAQTDKESALSIQIKRRCKS